MKLTNQTELHYKTTHYIKIILLMALEQHNNWSELNKQTKDRHRLNLLAKYTIFSFCLFIMLITMISITFNFKYLSLGEGGIHQV